MGFHDDEVGDRCNAQADRVRRAGDHRSFKLDVLGVFECGSARRKLQHAEPLDEFRVVLLEFHVGGRQELDFNPHRHLAIPEIHVRDQLYSLEDREPPHIHVAQAGRYAKFWVNPVTLASNRGFRSHELTTIQQLVDENREFFLEKWNAYFSGER